MLFLLDKSIMRGKGVFINPNNVFAGECKYDLPNGKEYTYNSKNERQYYFTYINWVSNVDKITAEKEAEIKRIEEKKRKKRKKQLGSLNYRE